MGGSVGGMLIAPAIGIWLDYTHKSYGPLFIWAGSAYLIALLVIHLLVPKLEQVSIPVEGEKPGRAAE
jgi:ACS family hexuronate transporter-like MFS transporter